MTRVNTDATLMHLSDVLARYKEVHHPVESRLPALIGVTHPTLGRMLNPDRPGAGGVAIRHWLRALQVTGHLPRIVDSLENAVSARLQQVGARFKPLEGEPESTGPDGLIDHALQRLGYALKCGLVASKPRSARELATKVGVTLPTVLNLLNPYGEHAGGTAIRHFVSITQALGLGGAFDRALSARGVKPLVIPPAGRSPREEMPTAEPKCI